MSQTPPPIKHRPPPDIHGATAFFQRFVRTPKMKQNFTEHQELRNRLITFLTQESSIPPYPAVVAKLEKMLREPEVNLAEIEETILLDPALVADVIRMGNSAIYGGGGVKGVKECINRIGLRQFQRFLTVHGSIKALGAFKTASAQDWQNFWMHSLLTARLAEMVFACYADPLGDAYVGGLLHDTGKLFLMKLFPDEFKRAIVRIQEGGISSEEAEFEIFGFSHADLSANLCMRWEMISPLIDAVKYHHHPSNSDVMKGAELLAASISAADGMANLCDMNLEGATRLTAEELQESEAWKSLSQFERTEEFEIDLQAEIDNVKALASSMLPQKL